MSVAVSESALTNDSFLLNGVAHHDVTIPQLQGRDKELQQLRSAYQRVRDTGGGEVVFVEGQGGSGKTCLVETALRHHVLLGGTGYYATGKFDQVCVRDPYSALVAAFHEVCDLVLQSEEEIKAAVKRALIGSLGDDIGIFARLVSGVSHITGVAADDVLYNQEFSLGHAFIRFKQQCRSFLRAVSSRQHPVVLFLDDLQFADEESLEITQSLVQSGLPNLLIVGAYRNDQSGPHETLVRHCNLAQKPQTHLQEEEEQPKTTIRRVSKIQLQDLSHSDVNEIIASLLVLDAATTQGLSCICHKKTSGNPYFVLEYLKLLETEGLLVFSAESQRWEWDESKILSETNVTGNILEVITERAKHTPKEVCELLQLAACFGFTFHGEMLLTVAESEVASKPELYAALVECHSDNIRDVLQECLSVAQKEGFIEGMKDNMYQWRHDRVVQSFASLISPEEIPPLHYRIAECLSKASESPKTNSLSFIVDQFNLGIECIRSSEKRLEVARRNLHVGEIAVSKSAFASGRQYFVIGISLLPSTAWDTHYNLTLQLYTNAAKAAHCTGHASVETLVQTILAKGKTLEDRFTANHIQVSMLGVQGHPRKSMDAADTVLRELGVKLPKRPNLVHIILELLRTRQLVRKKTDEMIVSLPMLDERRIKAMKLLCVLLRASYFESPELLVLLSLRIMRISIQYGLCALSPHSFAMYGTLQSIMKKYDAAFRFGMLSIRLLSVLDAKEAESRTIMFVYTNIHHLKRPLREAIDPFMQGYRSGIHYGDVEFGLVCGISIGHAGLTCGASLDDASEYLRRTHEQMVEFNQVASLAMLCPILQTVLNLRGESEDPVHLTGEIMNEGELLQRLEDEKNELALGVAWAQCYQVACFFEAWYVADQYLSLILSRRQMMKAFASHYASITFRLFLGLTYLAQYRVSGLRRHLVLFRKNKKFLGSFETKGVRSYLPILEFFHAEEIALVGNKAAVQAAYDDAISFLQECQHTHMEALCNEHAGNTMIRRFQDHQAALVFYSNSKQKYAEWNAWAKVDHLEAKCDKFASTANDKLPSVIQDE